jgi:zinc protease
MRTLIVLLLSLLVAGLARAGVEDRALGCPLRRQGVFHRKPVCTHLDVQVDFAAGGAYRAGRQGRRCRPDARPAGGVPATLDEEAIAGRLADIGARLGGGADSDRASVSLRTLSSRASARRRWN